jgi:hypothetical protein
MKSLTDRLAVVTATLDRNRAAAAIESWRSSAAYDWPVHVIDGQFGVVPAFAEGVRQALQDSPAEVIACLHDDVLIEERDWDVWVLSHFEEHPGCGLAGFGGATGLGSQDLYYVPYAPVQLARVDFRSNMRDAEAHGQRTTQPCRVACLDGFSLIGRRRFFANAWAYLDAQGLRHHYYDSAIGCLAKRWGEEVWLIPAACHHESGQTTKRNQAYRDWAYQQDPQGNAGLWDWAHRWAYEEFRDVLPIRV